MRSRTSYFNSTVLKKHLTRFWPVWAAYLLIWVFVLPFPLLRTQTADMLSAGSGLAPALAAEIVRANMADHILQVSGAITVLYTLFYGAVVAVAVFHFMHSARAVSLYHALPVKREGLFLSSLAAGVIYSVGPHAVIALLTMLVGALRGVSLAAEALTWFYAACMMSLLWLSIGALAAVCSGNPIVQTVLYFIFNFVVVLVELVARYLGSMVLFGVGWSSPTLRFLSPAVLFITGGPGLPEGLVDYRYDVMTDSASYVFQGWSALAWYLLAAAVIAVCALLIYRRRRSESAGDVISVRCLKPVFKYCLTFGLALGLGTMLWWMFNRSGNAYLTTGDVVSLALWMLFAAAIGYLAGEMLVKKTLRIWKPKMFLGLIVSLVIVAAGVFLLRADVLGIEKRLPAAADVESVFINGSMTRAWDSAASDPETIQEVLDLNRLILDNKEVIRRDANNFGYEEAHTAEGVWYDSQRTAYFRFNYLLKNGSTVVRTYTVPVTVGDIRDTNTVAGRYLAIANDPDQLLRQAALPEGGELQRIDLYPCPALAATLGAEDDFGFTGADARTLYNAILADAAEGTVNRVVLIYDETVLRETYADSLVVQYTVDATDGSDAVYYQFLEIGLRTDSAHTLQALRDLGVDTGKLTTQYEDRMNTLPPEAEDAEAMFP